jgi:hypothetical protein
MWVVPKLMRSNRGKCTEARQVSPSWSGRTYKCVILPVFQYLLLTGLKGLPMSFDSGGLVHQSAVCNLINALCAPKPEAHNFANQCGVNVVR